MPVIDMKSVIIITLLLLFALPVQGLVEPARIAVTSTPSGALACIDSVYCDTTDTTFMVTGNAWHSIVITDKGYAQWSGTVFAVSGQTSLVDAEMQRDLSATALKVITAPGGGIVCLDNSECYRSIGSLTNPGITQFRGVSEGYHTITVDSPPGYQNYYSPVYINLAKTTYLTITLDRLVPQVNT